MAEGPPDRHAILADAARMNAVAAGDTGVFETLMRAETARLVSLSASILGNRAEGEEVAQDTLLRLWRQAPNWEPKARITTWLYRVAYRLSIDRLRRRRPSLPIAEIEDTMPDDAPTPEEAMWLSRRTALIDRALASLPPRQRAAIVLAYGEGLGQAEAAAALGLTEEAYESLLARGRRKLKVLVAAAQSSNSGSGTDER